MEPKYSALILVLLNGALCSCAFAYYFPDGPPHRPLRQAAPPPGSVVTFKPEPGLPQSEEDPPKPVAVPTSEDELDDISVTVPANSSAKPLKYIPEPRRDASKQSQVLTFGNDSMDPVPVKPEPSSADEDRKPEPRDFPGFQMVPKRMAPNSNEKQRQSSRCSQSYSFSQPGQTAVVQSLNYPRGYPNNIQSSICFTSPSGTTMTVVCDDFNVEYSRSCSYDYFGVALSGNPSSIQKYCGRGKLRSPSTSGNSLAVVFKSDYSNPGSSSRNPYRFSCSVSVSGSSGGGSGPTTTTAAPPPPLPGNCTCGQRNDGSRIVGGTNAQVNEFPWRCYLKTKVYSFFCGCSIISNRWVLTAAHCTAAVMPLQNGDELIVVVGDHDRSIQTDSASQEIPVESVHDDPAYDENTMDHDVSLLKLSRSITYTNAISPICLPFKYANDEFSGTTVTSSGWGTTSQGGSVSNILKEVDLPVLTTQQCSEYYPGQITERMICTYSPGKDTCQGDSGGSIDLNRNGRYYHIGIVSWGIGCARQRNPGVYAKTTKFLSFITSTSGESFCQV